MMEMIYFAGGKPTADATFIVKAYLARGKPGVDRSGQYYSGHVVMAATGGNGYYFQGYPQQRMAISQTCGEGFQARNFNPRVGDMYYLGLLGRRPKNWEAELKDLEEAAGDTPAAE